MIQPIDDGSGSEPYSPPFYTPPGGGGTPDGNIGPGNNEDTMPRPFDGGGGPCTEGTPDCGGGPDTVGDLYNKLFGADSLKPLPPTEMTGGGTYPIAGSSSGTSPVLLLVVVGLIAAAYFWYKYSKKHGGGEQHNG